MLRLMYLKQQYKMQQIYQKMILIKPLLYQNWQQLNHLLLLLYLNLIQNQNPK